ncbi:hypothetical protein AWC38_SpisGene20760 [Stylophora pistillata]|uniref:YqaJ viral recombinase domain-containing protein n=1 Tax=Stylophora pistillata TaxID=50429 RepID=A0A2B4RF84_STYPI|nr:hypothetical protein AWC38_SpisGene20760 [Stylophora pistillata]
MSKTSLPQTWHVPQRTAGMNPREVQEVLVQQVKPTAKDRAEKKKTRRVDGVRSTLYNPITEKPPAFYLPELVSQYAFVPSPEQLHFMEELCVTKEESKLYEEETQEQADTQKWHDLRAQRLSSIEFKEVCTRGADFESLAARQLKKTVHTVAMRHGIKTGEEAAAAYADSVECNVFPAGIVINPSRPHLVSSPDGRVYDPSEVNPWGLLEIKCPLKDSIFELKYLKCVNVSYRLKTTHSYYYQVMGQLLLTGCQWVDFYAYCKTDFHCERLRFEAEFCSEVKMKLDQNYFEYLLPKLLQVVA